MGSGARDAPEWDCTEVVAAFVITPPEYIWPFAKRVNKNLTSLPFVVRASTSSSFGFAVALNIEKGRVGQPLESDEKFPSGTHPVLGAVHVLIVDSDIIEGERLKSMLEEDGYLVASIASAEAAFDVIKTETPDVIVAEVECREPSGHDLCAIVKKSERQ
jgi:Response regulator receiver domain